MNCQLYKLASALENLTGLTSRLNRQRQYHYCIMIGISVRMVNKHSQTHYLQVCVYLTFISAIANHENAIIAQHTTCTLNRQPLHYHPIYLAIFNIPVIYQVISTYVYQSTTIKLYLTAEEHRQFSELSKLKQSNASFIHFI